MQAKALRYVLVTPARNEVAYIERTIQSVIAQTIRPVKWAIVSDGSTDGTDELVEKYAATHTWIELVRMPERRERNFAGKINAFNAGYARMGGEDYDAIGCLDGDISFDDGYFAFLLGKLALDPTLGLVGTPYQDPFKSHLRLSVRQHRTRDRPLPTVPPRRLRADRRLHGGQGRAVDRIADNIAIRMNGWKTRTYTDKVYLHHRPTGTAQQNVLMAKFKDGAKDYSVGSSLLWELFRTAYQMTRKPLFLGGLMLGSGYFWALVRRVPRPVSREMVEFCRREQMQRLKTLVRGRLLPGRAGSPRTPLDTYATSHRRRTSEKA